MNLRKSQGLNWGKFLRNNMDEEISVREHRHIQSRPWHFQSNSYAPLSTNRGGTGKARFTVEINSYLDSVGWEAFDLTNVGSEMLVAIVKYIQLHERLLGYEHIGNSSADMKKMLENIWGKKLDI